MSTSYGTTTAETTSISIPTSPSIANAVRAGTTGSEQLASDLYGVGVRLGLYFQTVGLLFSLFRTSNENVGAGVN